MAEKLFLFVWSDRVESPRKPGMYYGGFWSKWCAGVDGDEPLHLRWIANSLARSDWVKRPHWVYIGPVMPTEPPVGANVSRIIEAFDNETPPGKPTNPLP